MSERVSWCCGACQKTGRASANLFGPRRSKRRLHHCKLATLFWRNLGGATGQIVANLSGRVPIDGDRTCWISK